MPLAQARSRTLAEDDRVGDTNPNPSEGLRELEEGGLTEEERAGEGVTDDHERIKHNFWRLDAQGRVVHATPQHRAWDKGRLEQVRACGGWGKNRERELFVVNTLHLTCGTFTGGTRGSGVKLKGPHSRFVQVVVLCRHGVRLPEHSFPNFTFFPVNKSWWSNFGGQLSPVRPCPCLAF